MSDSIADRVGRLILDGSARENDGSAQENDGSAQWDHGTDQTTLDHLELVARAAEAHEATRDLLHQSVATARAGGHSWAAIGSVLGLTRQAAQQRFGGTVDKPGAVDQPMGADYLLGAEVRWLGPVTAFDEMAELALAGRRGWRTVDAGMLKHKVVRTPTQWEHRRVVWTRPAAALEQDGWQVAVRAFPWLYLVRDTGIPAED